MWKNEAFLAIEKMQIKTIKVHHYTPIKLFCKNKKLILAKLSVLCFSKARAKRTVNPSNLSEVQFGNM